MTTPKKTPPHLIQQAEGKSKKHQERNTMNTTNSTANAQLRDWAALAVHEYREEIARVKALPEFHEWTNEIFASQEKSKFLIKWNVEDCLAAWMRENGSNITFPPFPKPYWATEQRVDPEDDGELVFWIIQKGTVEGAEIVMTTSLDPGGNVTSYDIVVGVETSAEEVVLPAQDIDKVIAALTNAKWATVDMLPD
jgi:hypothetical protein